MKGLTRSNVAYNLHISPHRKIIEYGDCAIEYVFSSNLYKTKFEEKRESNRVEVSESLRKRFGFTINSEIIADLRLYKNIEKRGYLIYCDRKEVICQEKVILDGLKMT